MRNGGQEKKRKNNQNSKLICIRINPQLLEEIYGLGFENASEFIRWATRRTLQELKKLSP